MTILTHFTGKLYADRSFTVGRSNKKLASTPKSNLRDNTENFTPDSASKEEASLSGVLPFPEVGEPRYKFDLDSQRRESGSAEVLGDSTETSEPTSPESPLFIKAPQLSQTSTKTYGSRGITRYGRRAVRNIAWLLQERYTRKRLGFVTCTLPSFPEEIHRLINLYWNEVTRRFYQKLKRLAEKRDHEFLYTGVTEIQEKRFEKSGIPCPHLHFVYLCRPNPRSTPIFSVFDLWCAWNKSIVEVVDLYTPGYTLDTPLATGSCHVQTVKKSAANYLGKYLSKGSKTLKAMQEAGWCDFPKQWWTASMQCKKIFRASIIVIPSGLAKEIFQDPEVWIEAHCITNIFYVYVEGRTGRYCTAITGKVSEHGRDIIKESCT